MLFVILGRAHFLLIFHQLEQYDPDESLYFLVDVIQDVIHSA